MSCLKIDEDIIEDINTDKLCGRCDKPCKTSWCITLDDPDEFKVIVILEQLMKAADVAANMQGWETMVSWCKRLFEEQKKCHDDGRGEDPITEWHENQLGFFESYTMPLACRLAETGVFGFEEVQMLVNGVRQNNTRWMIEGRSVLNKMVKEWSNKQGKLC